jgi:hypothetical protein
MGREKTPALLPGAVLRRQHWKVGRKYGFFKKARQLDKKTLLGKMVATTQPKYRGGSNGV